MNRHSFGIKTAPSIFNSIMCNILKGLPGVLFYIDDIIIFGATLEKCYQNLRRCLDVLRKYDLHLNIQKCQLFKEEIEFLGYIIGHGSIKKSPTKVAAVQQFPRSKHIEEANSFLGLGTYYSKFIPNLS